jgi:high-affinity iron transporter
VQSKRRWLGKWAGGLVLVFSLIGYGAAGSAEVLERAQTALHLLDYISVDYPEFVQNGQVVDAEEYQEQLEFAQEIQRLVKQLPENPHKSVLVEQGGKLLALIQDKASGAAVSEAANRLYAALIQTYQIEIAPKQAPDLQAAGTLYQTHCAACHGVEGRGNGLSAQDLSPAPTDFHDPARHEQRSVYSLFNAITLGVSGTAMPRFRESLSEQERWALAFYVSTLPTTAAEREAGAALWQEGVGKALFADLHALVTQTPHQVKAQEGETTAQVLAYLRGSPAQVARAESPLDFSRLRLEQSLAAYREGEREGARQLAIEAYLEGFELVETRLDTVAPELRLQIEQAMMAYRKSIRDGVAVAILETQQEQLQSLLKQAQNRLQSTRVSATTLAMSALVILLREGLEAVLIVAAIISFLVRAERRDALIYVHLGWILALVLGIITWFVALHFISISGAQRELTEGVAALLAAAILLYVGFWLHGKAYAQRWQAFIAKQVRGMLDKRTLWALVLLSFLAVYREVFETVLFYQALWTQAGTEGRLAVLGGFVAGAVLLVLLSGLIFYYSIRIPIKFFFGTTSILLALLAVVLAGKGIGALQEAGLIPVDPVTFPNVPALGIYPNWQVLAIQVGLLALIGGGFAYTYFTSRRSSAVNAKKGTR